jgi:glycosyltransferase involved in cell wall biosynthesis
VSSPPAKLTFAIPFYSGEKYLRRAIESALRQSRADWELVICDDQSPSRAAEDLVRSLGDPRIRYQRNDQNLGMARNWNHCLDVAATDLVTLLHDDDELLPDYAEKMLVAAERWPDAAAFFCAAQVIGEDSRPRFSFPDFFKRFLIPSTREVVELRGERAVEALLRGNFIMCPTLCWRKSRLDTARFQDQWKMVMDLEMTTRLLVGGATLVGLPDVCYAYRRHGKNATVRLTSNLLRFEEEVALDRALGEQALQRGWRLAARAASAKWIIKLNLLYCIALDLPLLRPRRAWDKLAFLARKTG